MESAALTLEDRVAKLQSSTKGLTYQQAASRLVSSGPNVLHGEIKHSALKLLIKQFQNPLIYLLIVACILSLFLRDASDAGVIAIVLFINAGLGFYQEYKSGKAIEHLQKLVSKQVIVLRDGTETLVDEKEIVPGDVVILKEGDVVTADLQLIHAEDVELDESSLSGESVAVPKSVAGDNILYAGTTVVEGEALGIVYATGQSTKLGKIAHLSVETKRITQYEKSLSEFSGFLIKTTFVTLAFVFLAKIVINGSVSHLASLALFMIALSIAVVPEAMPVIATVTLSSGALKLAKQHVIAKTLSAVEDLGNINVLCSDKTGTLTQNKQSVKQLIAKDESLFMHLAMASLESTDIKHRSRMSSFDQAFVDFIPSDVEKSAQDIERIEELPFDPQARRRRVVFKEKGRLYLVEVGSVETLLELTNDSESQKYLAQISEDGQQGLRHLGIAYKEIHLEENEEFDIKLHEDGLNFAGYVALEDPLRPSAKRTIKTASRLGVSIKILSGDSREVTGFVAREVGLISDSDKVFTGEEISKMSDLELSKIVIENNAFARLDPEQKYRIIQLLKLNNNVVGYQGDGINDAPSLKLADVAIAVNHATDVARDSADILLLNNDLGVIVNGIRYGRGIFANINKYIRYTMIGNFGNFFALSALFLLSAQLPLLTIQLLLTNMLGDVPLVAISTDNVDPRSLQRPSHYSMHSLIFISMVLGSYTAIFEVLFYALIRHQSIGVAQTSLYLYLTIIGFVVIMAVRNRDHFWKAVKMSRALVWSFGAISIITIGMIYFPPTRSLFSFSPLSGGTLALIFGMTVIYFVFLDIIKTWFYSTSLAQRVE